MAPVGGQMTGAFLRFLFSALYCLEICFWAGKVKDVCVKIVMCS